MFQEPDGAQERAFSLAFLRQNHQNLCSYNHLSMTKYLGLYFFIPWPYSCPSHLLNDTET